MTTPKDPKDYFNLLMQSHMVKAEMTTDGIVKANEMQLAQDCFSAYTDIVLRGINPAIVVEQWRGRV